VIDVIAGDRWTDEDIPDLLLQLNAATVDEVDRLAALPQLPPRPDQRRFPAAVTADTNYSTTGGLSGLHVQAAPSS